MFNRRFIPIWLGIVIALFGLAAMAQTAQAAPAAPIDIPMTQPDGTPFTARQWGDEWLHGYETVDGYTIIQVEDGSWVYAALGADGALTPVRQDGRMLLAGKDTPPSQASQARPSLPADAPSRELPSGGPLLARNTGTERVLMVMVNFLNRTRTYNPVTVFLPKFFGASSSIRDFYLDASFNALTLEPAIETYSAIGSANDGLIEVTLNMNHPSNTNESRTIAAAAYNAVNPYINFASYDTDGDGYVSGKELHFIMIIAGYEESYGGCITPCIWGHQWNLASPLLLDGVYVGTSSADGDYGGYAMFGEIHYDHAATIGIMVHEMGHNLTWPDLYDTDGGSEGVGEWSIMGSASWNGMTYPGDTPGLPDAFLKWYQGWITPTTAVSGETYLLDRTDTTPEALLVGTNPGGVNWEFTRYSGAGEYWLVENRQKNGYDAGLPGCGILVWHIDETVTSSNSANANEARPLVYLEQADGLYDLQNQVNRGDGGDPYPGTSSNRWFNDSTNPNSRYYSGASSNFGLTVNSTSCASQMSVSFTSSAPPANPSTVYLPLVQLTKEYTGRVTYRGSPAKGKTITLRFYDGYSYSTWATTTTDSNGYYSFPPSSLPPTGGGQEFYVRWINDAGTTSYLYAWYCEYVSGSTDDKYTCNFDIQDVALSSPAHNAKINLPYTFTWVRRTTTTDAYEVDWWDTGLGHYMWTSLLPYKSSFTLYGIPSFFYTGYPYDWTVYVYGPNGYGVPYYYRWVTFLDRSSPPLEGTGRMLDLMSTDDPADPRLERFGPRHETVSPHPASGGVKTR